jgi:hypothetical protein
LWMLSITEQKEILEGSKRVLVIASLSTARGISTYHSSTRSRNCPTNTVKMCIPVHASICPEMKLVNSLGL